MIRRIKTAVAVALAAAAVSVTPTVSAKDVGPFAAFAGSWSGSGQVRFQGGRSERIACRAYYTPRDGGSSMSLALRCASKDNKIDLRSSLAVQSGRVTGSWEERTFNASGSLSGRASGGSMTLAISGGGLSGSMQVSTSGSSQSVSISTSGAGLAGVSISLSKG